MNKRLIWLLIVLTAVVYLNISSAQEITRDPFTYKLIDIPIKT